MTNSKFSSTFKYRTKTEEQRLAFYKKNNIKNVHGNSLYFPYDSLCKFPYVEFEYNDFERLIDHYIFKQSYYSMILKYILRIEIAFKEAISYVIGTKYGDHTYINDSSVELANDYLSYNNYSQSKSRKDVINILRDLKKKIINPPQYFYKVIEYKDYTNVPPYIFAEDLMFSAIVDWFYILKAEDKDDVISIILQREIDEYDKQDLRQFFTIALRLLKDARNNYAHSSESYFDPNNHNNIRYETLSKLFVNDVFSKAISKNQYNNYIKKSPQSVTNICILVFLDRFSEKYFLEEFDHLISKSSQKLNIKKEKLLKDLSILEFEKLVEKIIYESILEEERLSGIY